MQISLNIKDSYYQQFLDLIKTLPSSAVKVVDENLEEDPHFYERKKELHQLKEDVKSGKMETSDFNDSIDELISELKS